MTHPTSEFWRGRRVLLTGHTGFKRKLGAVWLHRLGAEVHGYALAPDTHPSLWAEIGQGILARETIADLADEQALTEAVDRARPQIVIHMAAQALVRESYRDPVGTIATNAMGTVNLLEALRHRDELQAVLVVTTDKVYANADTGRDFVEDDRLGGKDPYSASKAAAEILTASYAASYFAPNGVAVATARAGNVIGGGDWSADRLIPDIWRAIAAGTKLKLRNPDATRPWQHVLEPLAGYFAYAEALATGRDVPRALNFGPLPGHTQSVAAIAESISAAMGSAPAWERDGGDHPPEMQSLSLDPDLARRAIGWTPRLDADATIDLTADWYSRYKNGEKASALCQAQIERYEAML